MSTLTLACSATCPIFNIRNSLTLTARTILEQFYQLPDTVGKGIVGLHERFAQQGFHVVIEEGGKERLVTDEELAPTS